MEEIAIWYSSYSVTQHTLALRLLCFRRHGKGTPILIVPPQAGHHSYIADYGPGQSLVESALNNYDGPVYAIEWKSCTFERRGECITSLLDQLHSAVKAIGGKVKLVGLCQGGWLTAIYATLYPVEALVLAGTPIDTSKGDSSLHKVSKLPLYLYQMAVFWGGGLMRGKTMLRSWKSNAPVKHYLTRHIFPSKDTKKFYKWYNHTQDLAGGWYLWAIENLFQKNKLGRNVLSVGGRAVDLRVLKNVHIVVGSNDDITPPEQSLALLNYIDASVYTIRGGHIGVFMSKKGIQDVWNNLYKEL